MISFLVKQGSQNLKLFSKFQAVIVMEMGQMVFHAITPEYAVVKQISSITNVMDVILVFLTFQHVKKVCYMTLLQILLIQGVLE